MPDTITKYFPSLTVEQKDMFSRLLPLYKEWNSKINVISRKDMENFYVHHVLHSLAITRIITFSGGTEVLDVGTGGGFPGIPLAIVFPLVRFTLLDSIEKKIKVVSSVARSLQLRNVTPVRARAEDLMGKYDFVISRAVSSFPDFVSLSSRLVRAGGKNNLANGIICLKGGDLSGEITGFGRKVKSWDIRHFFDEPFFETKRIVYLPV
jgi:16S rRNA (guanine527-N7)-methyltransferase